MCIKCGQEGWALQNKEKQINLKEWPQKQWQTLISQDVSYFFVYVNNSIANLIKEITSYLKTRETVNKRLEMSPALGAVTSGSVTADSLLLGFFSPCRLPQSTIACSVMLIARHWGALQQRNVDWWNCSWWKLALHLYQNENAENKFLFIRINLSPSLQLLWVPNCAGSDAASPPGVICTQANMNGHGGAGSACICP